MKYSVTSAEAAKMIKKVTNEKNSLIRDEQKTCVFNAAFGENIEEVRPDYDYEETQRKIAACNEKIRLLKHAVNQFNVSQTVGDTGMTIDQVLVYLPQLTYVCQRLEKLQDRLSKKRSDIGGMGRNLVIDYEYANYSVEKAREDYVRASDELARVQTALDLVNSTVKMEIDLPD
jgi:hypothetical protein